jgi:hypothetical protein
MFKNLIKTLKVQDWAREYPIKTTSVAAVIGFFVGEKVTEVYGESKSPGIEIEARPAKPESIPAKVPSKTSAFSEISSVLLVKGADLLKDLAYTWFVQEVLPKQKKQREAVDSLAENLDAGHKEE